MANEELREKFFELCRQVDEAIRKKEEPAVKARKRNLEAWQHAESKLKKIQKDYRSEAYRTIKTFSLMEIGFSERTVERLKSELTNAERTVLFSR